MNETTKKCPMCAEQIPAEATTCEYCGTKFEVRVEEQPVAPMSPPKQPVPTPSSAPKRTSPWVWIAAGLGLLLVLAVVGGGILVAQNGLSFLATPTNTPRPTSTPRPTRTPNYEATRQAQNTQAAATAQFAWVQEFAQPILDDVHNRQPNFEDDFSVMSGRFVRWGEEQGITFDGNAMIVNTNGKEWVGAGGSLIAVNFVLEFDFTPQIISNPSTAAVNFRGGDKGGYNFSFDLHDEWWGMGSMPSGEEYRGLDGGSSSETGLNRRTTVIIIAKGGQFAFYANDKPLLHVVNSQFQGDWVDLGVWSPNGPAEVKFDNVKFWNLDNLNP